MTFISTKNSQYFYTRSRSALGCFPYSSSSKNIIEFLNERVISVDLERGFQKNFQDYSLPPEVYHKRGIISLVLRGLPIGRYLPARGNDKLRVSTYEYLKGQIGRIFPSNGCVELPLPYPINLISISVSLYLPGFWDRFPGKNMVCAQPVHWFWSMILIFQGKSGFCVCLTPSPQISSKSWISWNRQVVLHHALESRQPPIIKINPEQWPAESRFGVGGDGVTCAGRFMVRGRAPR